MPRDALSVSRKACGRQSKGNRSLNRPRDRLALPFGASAGELGFAAPLTRGGGRTRRNAPLLGLGRPLDEIDQPFIGVLPISLLRAKTPRHDDDYAIGGHSPPSMPAQAHARRFVEARRACRIEAKLHRGGDFVDVLPAGAAGPDKALFDLALVERDAVGDPDH